MSVRIVITSLAAFALAAACGHRPAPVPAAEADRSPDCPPDSAAVRDSGVDLGSDVYRGPRYAVDSSGKVETLPPVPSRTDSTGAASADSARAHSGCRNAADSSADTGADSSAR
ncbi:MAG: hypothetical protein ACTHM9_06810 [Gemmatimonadales bacterium]